ENMAEVVWGMLQKYSLVSRVMAFMMDNTTNNDTMVMAIEQKCKMQGIPFSAKDSCLRCMPHMVHLVVLKLLEGIGAISKGDRQKAKESRTASYQDSVSALLDAAHDEEAALFNEVESDSEDVNELDS
ncbi:hypothetical protein EV421DRAFT_1708701, partial [Armillaria borealis]